MRIQAGQCSAWLSNAHAEALCVAKEDVCTSLASQQCAKWSNLDLLSCTMLAMHIFGLLQRICGVL